MASELNRCLSELADRGEWRGPEVVMAAAKKEVEPV